MCSCVVGISKHNISPFAMLPFFKTFVKALIRSVSRDAPNEHLNKCIRREHRYNKRKRLLSYSFNSMRVEQRLRCFISSVT